MLIIMNVYSYFTGMYLYVTRVYLYFTRSTRVVF